jgi:uncharacterized membrane protein YcjF (UPF0283 family)
MTCSEATSRLSEYLDRTLDADTRALVTTHLERCDACRDVLSDLDHIRSSARTLGPITPPAHLWHTIAGQIRLEGPSPVLQSTAAQRPVFTRADAWQWLGLAAALLIVTAGVYLVARPTAPTSTTVVATTDGNATTTPTVETVEDTLRRAEAEYEKAIAQLEQILKTGDPAISASAIATLQRSFTTIDSAITESRAALTGNPENQPARTSLFEALGSKVTLLQRTVVLMNEMRQGDAGGAADAAAGGGPTKIS